MPQTNRKNYPPFRLQALKELPAPRFLPSLLPTWVSWQGWGGCLVPDWPSQTPGFLGWGVMTLLGLAAPPPPATFRTPGFLGGGGTVERTQASQPPPHPLGPAHLPSFDLFWGFRAQSAAGCGQAPPSPLSPQVEVWGAPSSPPLCGLEPPPGWMPEFFPQSWEFAGSRDAWVLVPASHSHPQPRWSPDAWVLSLSLNAEICPKCSLSCCPPPQVLGEWGQRIGDLFGPSCSAPAVVVLLSFLLPPP